MHKAGIVRLAFLFATQSLSSSESEKEIIDKKFWFYHCKLKIINKCKIMKVSGKYTFDSKHGFKSHFKTFLGWDEVNIQQRIFKLIMEFWRWQAEYVQVVLDLWLFNNSSKSGFGKSDLQPVLTPTICHCLITVQAVGTWLAFKTGCRRLQSHGHDLLFSFADFQLGKLDVLNSNHSHKIDSDLTYDRNAGPSCSWGLPCTTSPFFSLKIVPWEWPTFILIYI